MALLPLWYIAQSDNLYGEQNVRPRLGIGELGASEYAQALRETLNRVMDLSIDSSTDPVELPRILNELRSFAVDSNITEKVTEGTFWNVKGKIIRAITARLKDETVKHREFIKAALNSDLFGMQGEMEEMGHEAEG